ncbi:MAG: hypothetical protein ABII13_04350, partial [Patescibacteria group bacterium]
MTDGKISPLPPLLRLWRAPVEMTNVCHLERSREIFLKDFSAPVEMTDGKFSPLPPLLRLWRAPVEMTVMRKTKGRTDR